MGVIQHTSFPVNPAIKMDTKNTHDPVPFLLRSPEITSQYIIDVLIDGWELKETGRFRGTINVDDVLDILRY
jgi:hypothetical protein